VKRAFALFLVVSACDGCTGCGERRVRETIAICSGAYGEVRFHPQEEWVWNPVGAGDGLAAGDWVRTGLDSRAQIKFEKTGSEIGIEPSSTIVIQTETAPEATSDQAPLMSRIQVEAGVVHGHVASAETNRPIEVSTPEGKTIRLVPSEPGKKFEYRVTVNRGGILELAVTKGHAHVNGADGSSVALAQGQAHDVVGGALVGETIELPSFPKLESPGVAAHVLYRPELTIDLGWSAVDVASEYRLQVASDPSFNKMLVDEVVKGTAGKFSPPGPGSYFWRVATRTATGREGEFGFGRDIRVVETLEDLLIGPPDDHLIKSTKDRPLVEFSWQAVVPPARYKLVVAKNRRLTQVIFETTTEQQKVATRSIPVGTFFWGVYAEGETSRPLFTKPRRLKIRKDVGLTTPDKVTF
jgi:hypothetical protein